MAGQLIVNQSGGRIFLLADSFNSSKKIIHIMLGNNILGKSMYLWNISPWYGQAVHSRYVGLHKVLLSNNFQVFLQIVIFKNIQHGPKCKLRYVRHVCTNQNKPMCVRLHDKMRILEENKLHRPKYLRLLLVKQAKSRLWPNKPSNHLSTAIHRSIALRQRSFNTGSGLSPLNQ